MQARKRDPSGWRLPAEELEAMIQASIRNVLADHRQLGEVIGVEGRDAAAIKTAMDRAAELGRSMSVPIVNGARDLPISGEVKFPSWRAW